MDEQIFFELAIQACDGCKVVIKVQNIAIRILISFPLGIDLAQTIVPPQCKILFVMQIISTTSLIGVILMKMQFRTAEERVMSMEFNY